MEKNNKYFNVEQYISGININGGEISFKLPLKDKDTTLLKLNDNGDLLINNKENTVLFNKTSIISSDKDSVTIKNDNDLLALELFNELGSIRLKLNIIEARADNSRAIVKQNLKQFNELIKEKELLKCFDGINTKSESVLKKIKEGKKLFTETLKSKKKILEITYQNAIFTGVTFFYMNHLDLKFPTIKWFGALGNDTLDEFLIQTPEFANSKLKSFNIKGIWAFDLEGLDNLLISLNKHWLGATLIDEDGTVIAEQHNVELLQENENKINAMLKIVSEKEGKNE